MIYSGDVLELSNTHQILLLSSICCLLCDYKLKPNICILWVIRYTIKTFIPIFYLLYLLHLLPKIFYSLDGLLLSSNSAVPNVSKLLALHGPL